MMHCLRDIFNLARYTFKVVLLEEAKVIFLLIGLIKLSLSDQCFQPVSNQNAGPVQPQLPAFLAGRPYN